LIVSALDILEKLGGPGAHYLNQLQRILVITDGTLTEILEAAALERVRLVKISQETVSSTTFDLHFTPAPGEVFLERKILIAMLPARCSPAPIACLRAPCR
jgi:chorismate-pyruvate lyase